MTAYPVNVPVEFDLGPASDTEDITVIFTGPDGVSRPVPALRNAEQQGKVRFAPSEPGIYTWHTELNNCSGEFTAKPYDGANPLFMHGRLRVAADRRNLEHADSAPFFWLGDTWWMGLTTRLDWPQGFQELTADRVEKGFSVIQIVAGPLPDFCATTASFDPQQANEGGLPWEKDWQDINPAFYDLADRRISYLVEQGLLPCIVAMWGYYLPFMGLENVKKHWRNLVARYAAYPVVWCLAGEARMPTYALHGDPEKYAAAREELVTGWTETARFVRDLDPYGNLVTIHPDIKARDQLSDPSLLDFEMLQTSHGGYHMIPRALTILHEALATEPAMPVFNAEPCYEGIMGAGWQEVQRFLFWASICSGAFGHTYGAQGMWAMNSRDEPFEGTTYDWGSGFWQDAMHYPGSAQVGQGAQFLRQLPFHKFRPLEEPCLPDQRDYAFAAGVPELIRVYYFGSYCFESQLHGMRDLPLTLEAGLSYQARYFDPRTGETQPAGSACADTNGKWMPPPPPSREDWVLVLERD